MDRSPKGGLILGALAALFYAPHFLVFRPLRAAGVGPVALQFHGLFWAALGGLALLLATGRGSELRMFNRYQTRFVVLAALGGYAFWLLQAVALEQGDPARVYLLSYAAPVLIVLMSVPTAERAGWLAAAGVALGFIGCMFIVGRAAGGVGGAGAGMWAALGAAACWALFSVVVRPVARQEAGLPVAVLVSGIGAACMLITCLSRGESLLGVNAAQLGRVALWGVLTVTVMLTLWVKCLGLIPAGPAAPLWYLGAVFAIPWAARAGLLASGWRVAVGTALVLLGVYVSRSGGSTRSVSLGDIIRG